MAIAVCVILGLVAVGTVFMVAACAKIERQQALWEEFYHPPDSEWKEEDDDEQH